MPAAPNAAHPIHSAAQFPYYAFVDRDRMYTVGSLFYAIYFFVRCGMRSGVVQNPWCDANADGLPVWAGAGAESAACRLPWHAPGPHCNLRTPARGPPPAPTSLAAHCTACPGPAVLRRTNNATPRRTGSFPMFYRMDEYVAGSPSAPRATSNSGSGGAKQPRWTSAQAFFDSLAAGMLVTILLDLWRISVGAITDDKQGSGGLPWMPA